MEDLVYDENYEDNFESALWKMIKERAKEKDISYMEASEEVLPEFQKTIRYRDTEFEDAALKKRAEDKEALMQRIRKDKKS